MFLPLLEENQMKLHTQGLSKPCATNYTATREKDKTSERKINLALSWSLPGAVQDADKLSSLSEPALKLNRIAQATAVEAAGEHVPRIRRRF